MSQTSTNYMDTTIKVKEEMNTVFIKIDEGIYFIHLDRTGRFVGRSYVSTKEVIDELNYQLKVAIYEWNETKTALSLVHVN